MDWQASGEYTDIRYETAEGIAKITIARPEVRNAFRPLTVRELCAPSTSRATIPRSASWSSPARGRSRSAAAATRDPRRRRLRRRAAASAG